MFKDFSEPSLENAIGLLRDRTQWPESFTKWDYVCPCTCAMGLFSKKWNKTQGVPDSEGTAKLLGISQQQGMAIFACLGQRYPDVTPEVVADELEKLLV
jgi:hypothetical protein